MKVFHFAGATLLDGSPLPQAGDDLPACDAVFCRSGWHGSPRAVDALHYAPGCNVAIRELSGHIETGYDKSCGSHCRMVTGYVDATDVLREFAEWCAERAAQHAGADVADGASYARAAKRAAWNAARAAAADAGHYGDDDPDTWLAAYYAECAAQEEWLAPRLLELLGQEGGR